MAGLGFGTMVQTVPFQDSIKVCPAPPTLSVPTATHADGDAHDTL